MTTDTHIVLITGANKGIGFATARELGRAGHTVLLGARDQQLGSDAAKTLLEEGLDVRFVRLDVTDLDTVTAAADLIASEYGRLDMLINNAGISRDRDYLGRPEEMPVAALREVYEVNVFGVVAVTNAMLPLLRKSAGGYLGNVSSGLGTVAFLADPDETFRDYVTLLAYNSSKAALNAVTLIYANALRDSGIRVNALSPGYCATDMNGNAGTSTAAEGGAAIAREVLDASGDSGVFLSEQGGTYPW
ncbi:MAG TPA: SDR family oxidoreductase [Pseudonocardiaceae bacterium]|nr:SDR family oxidoreductase [Pseudonocardiaceae bacterium]